MSQFAFGHGISFSKVLVVQYLHFCQIEKGRCTNDGNDAIGNIVTNDSTICLSNYMPI
jgi:hypothetical protein